MPNCPNLNGKRPNTARTHDFWNDDDEPLEFSEVRRTRRDLRHEGFSQRFAFAVAVFGRLSFKFGQFGFSGFT
jgi:hypothetical protein